MDAIGIIIGILPLSLAIYWAYYSYKYEYNTDRHGDAIVGACCIILSSIALMDLISSALNGDTDPMGAIAFVLPAILGVIAFVDWMKKGNKPE